jgi:hypothetical protein
MIALVPDLQTIRWHHAREEFVSFEFLGRTPEIKGAVVGPVGKRVWCYWTRRYADKGEENTLQVLRLVAEDKGAVNWETERMDTVDRGKYIIYIASLLVLAQQEAAKWDMDHVEIWNPTPVIVEAARRIAGNAALLVDRQVDSIPSLKWYGESSGHVLDELVWIGNEKYGWC